MNGTNGVLVASCLLAVLSGPVVSQVRSDAKSPAPVVLERPDVGQFQEPSVEPGRDVVAIQMVWTKRTPQDAAKRLQGAIQVMLGKAAGRLSKRLSYVALNPAVSGKDAGNWVRLMDTPLLVRYDARYDELRVLHEELDLVDKPAQDIGMQGARDVAERFLKQLADAGVVDARVYRQAAVQMGYKLAGDGPIAKDKPIAEGRIVGYRVTYRPRIQGFQLANAGIRLGITASGAVASVRVGGVTPQGTWRGDVLQPSAPGGARKVRIGTKQLMERFHRDTPKGAEARVAWSRVMYVMPENAASAVLEPKLVVSATHVLKTQDGPVASRRRTVGYSLTDPKAPPLDFDAPPARHEGTELVRGK